MFKQVQRTLRHLKKRQIAIIEPDKYPLISSIRSGFIDAFSTTYACQNFKVFNAGGNEQRLEDDIRRVLFELPINLVFCIGPWATVRTKELAHRVGSKMPVVFADVNEPLQHDLIDAYTASNTRLTGVVSFENNYHERISHLLRLQPATRHVMIVFNPQQDFGFVGQKHDEVAHALELRGIKVTSVPIYNKDNMSHAVGKTLKASKPNVIFTLRDGTILSRMQELAQVAQEHKVPIFASDLESVERGAAFGSGDSSYNLGLQAGDRAMQVLYDGVQPEVLPLRLYAEKYRVHVNKEQMLLQGLVIDDEGTIDWLFKNGKVI